jgi:LysR family glycine cleavage system transcriptional activator
MSRLPLQPIQGFLAAARARNLSRAADSLSLTVSALSHQIRALEQRLQQRLFERGPRGIRLTAEGQRLFDAVSEPFDALDRALRPCSRRDEVLTLSVIPSMASSWLVPRLPRFLAAHPQLEINLQSSSALVDFDRETDVDAALRYGPGQWPGLTATHLFDEWIAPLASPKLVAEYGGKQPQDLSRYPVLEDDAGRWPDWFTRYGGTAPKRFVARLDDAESLHRAAVSGLGVAMGRMTLARPLIDAGLLVVLSPERMKSDYAHYLVHPLRSDRHAGLLAFREWLLEQARAYARVLTLPEAKPAPAKRAKPAPSRPGLALKAAPPKKRR